MYTPLKKGKNCIKIIMLNTAVPKIDTHFRDVVYVFFLVQVKLNYGHFTTVFFPFIGNIFISSGVKFLHWLCFVTTELHLLDFKMYVNVETSDICQGRMLCLAMLGKWKNIIYVIYVMSNGYYSVKTETAVMLSSCHPKNLREDIVDLLATHYFHQRSPTAVQTGLQGHSCYQKTVD